MRVLFALLVVSLGATTLAYAADAIPPNAALAGQAVVVVGTVTASHGKKRDASGGSAWLPPQILAA